jgi:hypothetical protein
MEIFLSILNCVPLKSSITHAISVLFVNKSSDQSSSALQLVLDIENTIFSCRKFHALGLKEL